MPNHDSLVPYLFTRNIALRRVIESILNNCANTQASTLSVFICLHMLLRKWLEINRMRQMHLYPPFIQIFIRKNTRCQRLNRYFCIQATCSQTRPNLRIVVGNLHLPFFFLRLCSLAQLFMVHIHPILSLIHISEPTRPY